MEKESVTLQKFNMLKESASNLSLSLENTLKTQENKINQASSLMLQSLKNGGKILICGNGGSASQAQHFSAEIVVRFKENRKALSAISLTTDTSILTACGNDYSFNEIFSRQVEALAKENDILICLSTSGKSPNVIAAAQTAIKKGCLVLSLTGEKENTLEENSTITIKAQSIETSRVQEIHLFLIHHFADFIEKHCQ